MKKILMFLLLCNFYLSAHSVSVSREVDNATIGSKMSTVVTVSIVKVGVDGIAKLIEQVPEGFNAHVIDNGGGKVVFDDQATLKIVWLVLPVDSSITVRYKLVHVGTTIGSSEITGSFIFVQNEVKHEESIIPLQITVNDTVGDEQTVNSLAILDTIYKIQLGVFSSKKNINLFKGLPAIHFSKINGFYKYFSGRFDTEQEAKKIIPQARSKGFKEAFLITVHE